MKPLILKFFGINCFASEQTIDFEKLTKNGVFGIFGPTASGKSTILDAMTFALFGEVERSQGNGDFITKSESKAGVDLTFLCGKKYRIVRTATISKSGKYHTDATLEEGGKTIAEGARDCNAAIFEITGLSMADFSKCVALPQGQFAAFLQARPAERTALVGNLFGLDQYGDKLTIRANIAKSNLENEIKLLNEQINLLGQNVEAEIEALKKQKQTTKEQIEKQTQLIAQLSAKKQEKEKQEKENEEYLKLTEQLSELNQQNDEIGLFEKKLKNHKMVCEYVPKIGSLIETNAKLQSVQKNFDEASKTYQLAKIDLDVAKRDQDQIDKRLETLKNTDDIVASLKSFLAEEKQMQEKVCENGQFEAEIEALKKKNDNIQANINNEQTNSLSVKNKLLSFEQEKAKIQNKILELNQNINILNIYAQNETYAKVLKTLNKHFDELQQQNTIKQNDISRRNKLVKKEQEKLDEVLRLLNTRDDLAELVQAHKNKLDNLTHAKTHLDWLDAENLVWDEKISALGKSKDFIEAQIQDILKNIEDLKKAVRKFEQDQKTLENERDNALLDRAENTVASETVVGSTCPICGNVVAHLFPEKNVGISNINHALAITKKQIEHLNNEIGSKNEQKARFDEQIQQIEEQIKNCVATKKRIENSKQKLLIKFVDIGENAQEQFDKLVETTKENLKVLESSCKKAEQIKRRMSEIAQNNSTDGFEIVKNNEIIETIQVYQEKIQKILAENEFELLTNPSKTLSEIQEAKTNFEAQLESTNSQIELLGKQQLETLTAIEKLKFELDKNNQQIAEKQALISKNCTEIEQTKAKALELSRGYSSVEDKISKMLSAKADIVSKNEENSKKLKARTDAFTKENTTYQVLNEQRILLVEQKDKLESELRLVFEDLSQSALNKLVAFKLDNASEIETKIISHKQQVDFVENRLKTIKNVCTLDDVDYEKELTEASEKSVGLLTSLGSIEHSIETKNQSLEKQKQLIETRTKKESDLKTATILANLLRGKELLAFVAEEYLQEITQTASEKIYGLLGGHYSLVYKNKEFFVADHLDNGKLRSTSTLSGGETFIVSLALALSIAENILRLSAKPVDFFFLDEGFGTLDQELRESIVQSLMKLKETGLSIGLITHMEELKSEIRSRLVISRVENTDGSVVSKIRYEEDI